MPQHQVVRTGGEELTAEERRAADRALLFERAAAGLAHEGKNPLHNMMLHLQLMSEKLTSEASLAPVDRHLSSMREGIGRVDALLKAFGEFAEPAHLSPDLGQAMTRALLLYAYEARRSNVTITGGRGLTLVIAAQPFALSDLVSHATLAAISLARDGGSVTVQLDPQGARALLRFQTQGGAPRHAEAALHLAAMRRLAAEAPCELSLDTGAGAEARLSLSFPHPR